MVSLSSEEIERYINEISLGKKLVEVDGEFYVLYHPDRECSFRARLVYNKAFKEAREFGIPTREELEKVIYERRLYTEEDDEKIKELENKIKGQRAVLEKTFRVPARRDRLVGIIDGLERQIQDIKRKKLILMERTSEAKAKEEEYIFLCEQNTYRFDGHEEVLVWKNRKEYENDFNHERKTKLILEYMRMMHGIDVSIVRAIARSNLFVIRYMNSIKNSTPMFDRPAAYFTVDMLSLSYWANWYRGLYEMMPEDIPPEHLIDDDDALDVYMDDLYARKKNERELSRINSAKKAPNNKAKRRVSAYDRGDVIITASNPIAQDVEYTHNKKFKKTESESNAVRERGDKQKK